MRLQPRATAAPSLSETQRCHILGHTTDVNILSWLIKQSTQRTNDYHSSPNTPPTPPSTITKALLILRPTHNKTLDPKPSPPQPKRWHPLHNPEAWIYTDGFLKKIKPRLGAAIIHSPASTTTYIDASGQDNTHSIMRAELVAIQITQDKYKNDKCMGNFTDSQTSLQAIQRQLQWTSHASYHHHKPLKAAIVSTLQHRASQALPHNSTRLEDMQTFEVRT